MLVTQKDWIKADVATDAAPGYRHVLEDSIESGMKDKIYGALYDLDKDSGESRIQALNRTLKAWLMGGDSYVLGVSSDDQSLMIDYILPPGQLEPFPEKPQPPLEPGLPANIDHIVVLMMENRSFDHLLGYLSKEGGVQMSMACMAESRTVIRDKITSPSYSSILSSTGIPHTVTTP